MVRSMMPCPRHIERIVPEMTPTESPTGPNRRIAKSQATKKDDFLSVTAVALETETATCELRRFK